MRTAYISISFLSIILLCSFRVDPDSITLTGHLKIKSKKSATVLDGLHIFAKEGDELAGETDSDEEGNFTLEIERQEGGKKAVSIFYVDEKSDTILLKKVAHFANETPELTFTIE